MVTTVLVFPVIKFAPIVTRVSMTIKVSLHSTNESSVIVTVMHGALVDPAEKSMFTAMIGV